MALFSRDRKKKSENELGAPGAAPDEESPAPVRPSTTFYPDDRSGENRFGQLDISIAGKDFTVVFDGSNRGIFRATSAARGQINANDHASVRRISIPSSRSEDDLITAAANLASAHRYGNATPQQSERLGAIMLALDSGHTSPADVERLLPQGRSYDVADARTAPSGPPSSPGSADRGPRTLG